MFVSIPILIVAGVLAFVSLATALFAWWKYGSKNERL
jgi:hypothetical protein